ncbi:E3 ubiquitin-protein ligase PRT1-like isoform X2 [Rhododendron vialii]|uniref:E3 ubiquitin-protein ligase PRT1-like isoform X2 n=1 Tax=Rhododendron vialii TaxID=182163 RepID=UPI00265FFC6B|nr:E3 ubiquitin-protein ligase PRT1-like isoform X2 [Rhododendron vialii]
MENESDDVESGEQISESFICCVCLDLLYKPIVLGCGHVSCFWCVHRTMDGLHESHCPICRHPYGHFPTICQMLHFLLLKLYPVAYKTREIHILEEEKKTGCVSPKVDDLLCASHTKEELNHLDDQDPVAYKTRETHILEEEKKTGCVSPKVDDLLCASHTKEELNHLDDQDPVAYKTRETHILEEEKKTGCFSPKVDDLLCASHTKEELNHLDDQDNSTSMPKQITAESFKSTCTFGVKENYSPQGSCNKISGQVSIVDVSCATCKQLLFRPTVLNCGHVYCEACIELAGEAIRCHICQSLHPGGFPKVCLEFDHFLEEQFPEEYTARRGTVQRKLVQFQHESSPTCSTEERGFFHWLGEHGPDVHVGAGCDSCGMCPIKGDRYKCIDCKEAMGFDLCGDCYNSHSKLPGRFNQQHTPDHKFEKEKSRSLRNIMLQLLRGDSVNGLLLPSLSGDALENPENELPLVAPLTASDLEEPQNDDTQPTS